MELPLRFRPCNFLSILLFAAVACPPAPAATLAAGASHTCAIGEASREMRCWGLGADGRLGNGSGPQVDRAAPFPVGTTVSGWRSVAIGENHSCAIAADGAVYCWGLNSSGQLGDGTAVMRNSPVAVVGLGSGVVKLALGSAHSCALMQSGKVNCWGYGAYGQLGSGQTSNQTTPAEVLTLSDAVDIGAGSEHTCVALNDTTVKCWGRNHVGQVGDGSIVNRTTPVFASVGLSAVELAIGNYHSCARSAAGAVRCWGYNAQGELGTGNLTDSWVGVQVSGLASGVSRVVAGGYHSCALAAGAVLKCWGHNSTGQIGNTTTTTAATPVDVANLGIAVAEIAAGRYHTCVRASGNRIHCWGHAGSGRAGVGDTQVPAHVTRPLPVSGLPAPPLRLSLRLLTACAATQTGSASCWGANESGQVGDGLLPLVSPLVQHAGPRDVAGMSSGVIETATGGQHACALKNNGTVWCWGSNVAGQIGDQTTIARFSPVQVVGIANAVQIATGLSHSCARTAAGAIWCWGLNSSGQLGIGSTGNSLQAVMAVGMNADMVDVSAGDSHTCAVRNDGKVFCWGLNTSGQLGDSTLSNRSSPTQVNDGFGVYARVAAGGSHSCGLTSAGEAKCWGADARGQLGDDAVAAAQPRPSPAAVATLGSGVVRLAAGRDHTCALRNTGALLCWGYNASSQLGDGTTVLRTQPVAASHVSGSIREIALGADSSCAVLASGEGVCWGYNGHGRLGNGSVQPTLAIPQPIAQWLQNDLIFRDDFQR